MTNTEKDYCFCTLALGSAYRLMAKELAQDLKTYAPGVYLVVGTDAPEDFRDQDNVRSFKHIQQGLVHCYNDKRIILEKAWTNKSSIIFVDADTKITKPLPSNFSFSPGISSCHSDLIKHITKYRPQDLDSIKKVSEKLDIDVNTSQWIGESLFIVTKDQGKEEEFLLLWERLANYLELKGMNSGEGNIMGLAANKVGWQVDQELWSTLQGYVQHLDASKLPKSKTRWSILKKKLNYYFRLFKRRVNTLTDIKFYYF